MTLTKHTDDIWSIHNVLDVSICNDCILAAEDDNLFPNSIIDNEPNNFLSRNNYRLFVNSDELASLVWNNIVNFVPPKYMDYFASGLNTEFRFYKYFPTQEFKKHQDIHFEKSLTERSFFSLLIYLNDNFIGGETMFDMLSIKPKIGSALIFPHTLFHSGSLVLEGVKYVLRSDILYKK